MQIIFTRMTIKQIANVILTAFYLKVYVAFQQWNVYGYNSVFLQQDTLENLALEEIDQSNAVLFIHYDADTKMIYLYGKVRLLHNGSHSHSHPVRANSSWIIKSNVWMKAENSQRTLHHFHNSDLSPSLLGQMCYKYSSSLLTS